MTVDGAIRRFESLLFTAEERIRDFEQCFPSWRSNFRKDKELYEIAIQALKEVQTFNQPLTLEELRQMTGKPVWVEDTTKEYPYWSIVIPDWEAYRVYESYGKTWLAYRKEQKNTTNH